MGQPTRLVETQLYLTSTGRLQLQIEIEMDIVQVFKNRGKESHLLKKKLEIYPCEKEVVTFNLKHVLLSKIKLHQFDFDFLEIFLTKKITLKNLQVSLKLHLGKLIVRLLIAWRSFLQHRLVRHVSEENSLVHKQALILLSFWPQQLGYDFLEIFLMKKITLKNLQISLILHLGKLIVRLLIVLRSFLQHRLVRHVSEENSSVHK